MAVIEPGGVLGAVACAPPLTLRQVYSQQPGRCELRLVGSAAGPLPGDDLSLSLELRAGARATLRATGASLAQGRDGSGAAATLSIHVELAAGSDLIADPGALVVCHGSRVDVRVGLALAEDAAVAWRELIVLGRTGEPPGRATVRWDVTRAGRPVLRQYVDLSGPAPTPRVLACALISDPARAARTVVISPAAVAQRVDQHTTLVTVLGDDAATATGRLDELCLRACDQPADAGPVAGTRNNAPG
jgi:urease accessory protein